MSETLEHADITAVKANRARNEQSDETGCKQTNSLAGLTELLGGKTKCQLSQKEW